MSVKGSTSRPFMTWLPASSAPTNFAPPGSPNRRKPRPPLSPLDGFETASKSSGKSDTGHLENRTGPRIGFRPDGGRLRKVGKEKAWDKSQAFVSGRGG